MKVGCHISISGGIEKAPRRAKEAGCECFQIFTRSPRGGEARKVQGSVAKKFVSDFSELGFSNCYVHAPYIVNLASRESEIRKKSINMLVSDLEYSEYIGATCVVTHIGTSAGMERSEAVTKAARSLKEILDGTRGLEARLLIENSAGQGFTLGYTFEEIGEILDKAGPSLGVCLDTAHLFAAGYEMRSLEGFGKTIKNIDATFSIERVGLIHCNDSKFDLGSRKDRHEHIGSGKMGMISFERLFSFKGFRHVDFVAETPPPKSALDVKILKQIRQNAS